MYQESAVARVPYAGSGFSKFLVGGPGHLSIKTVKITQLNSLSFISLSNKLQSTTPECYFAPFLPVLKPNARIIAVKIIVNKSNGRFTFEFGNPLDFERLVLHFDAITGRN